MWRHLYNKVIQKDVKKLIINRCIIYKKSTYTYKEYISISCDICILFQ